MASLHLKNEFDRRGVQFMVGRSNGGDWVVCDRDDLIGGTFPDRAAAIQFAMSKSNHQPGAVCCVPDILSFKPLPLADEKMLHASVFKAGDL